MTEEGFTHRKQHRLSDSDEACPALALALHRMMEYLPFNASLLGAGRLTACRAVVSTVRAGHTHRVKQFR